MQNKRGKWIGFLVSLLCFTLVWFTAFCAWNPDLGLGPLLSDFCHQLEDRCFHIDGVAIPLCVRCIWIYLGLAVGHTLFLFWNPSSNRISRVLIGVIALMILDVVLENIGLYQNWFWTRVLTGFLFGTVVSHFTLLGFLEIYSEFSNPITYVRSKFFSGRTR